MQKIDPAFLFESGDQLRKVKEIGQQTPLGYGHFLLSQSTGAIEQVVLGSIYSHLLRLPCHAAAQALLAHMMAMKEFVLSTEDWTEGKFTVFQTTTLQSLYTKFETLFLAELQSAALYLVAPKGGFDTTALIERGEAIFSGELAGKVPDALPDLEQATRCIAFELPTAAGFHLHRAHESVLRVYWDCVTGGAERPKENNMGVYLRELDNRKVGKPAIRSHLRSIKDFHRNPLMHPEESLDGVDQAIDLMAAIRCSIGYMLQEIPGNEPPMLAVMEAAE